VFSGTTLCREKTGFQTSFIYIKKKKVYTILDVVYID
jgi:hypothetical protein